MSDNTPAIRRLNDELRRHLIGGTAVLTPGLAALGADFTNRLVRAIAAFDDFHYANDPHQEHDFGQVELEGHKIIFKIDYYDKQFSMHSPDPADPAVTERVMTIMLASEY